MSEQAKYLLEGKTTSKYSVLALALAVLLAVVVSEGANANKSNQHETYIYSKDTGYAKSVNVIEVHFKNVFRGAGVNLATVDRIRQVSDSDHSRVIFENSRKTIITSGTPLKLEEGYELAIKSIDIDGNSVSVELSRYGMLIDAAQIILPKTVDDTYIYSKDMDTAKPVETIKVHFKNAFWGAVSNLATIDRIRQVSDSDPSRVIFENFRKTIITSGTPLKLEDSYELAIKSIDIDGNKVYVELTKNGNVIDSSVVIPPQIVDDTYIYSKDTDSAESVNVIEVHFKKVLRGADSNLVTVDRIRQVSDSDPSRVIFENSRKTIITSGTPLKLEEGYELAIKSIDIDGNKVYVELTKNGNVIDSAVVISPQVVDDTYIYSKDTDSAKDVKVISAHFKNAFRGTDANFATIDRIQQVSDSDPSRVIFENSRKTIITSGTPLKLEDGYELAIKSIDIDGNKVYVELTKNGNVIDSAVVISPQVVDDTYIYSKDTDSAKDVKVISVHFKNVFRGGDVNLVTVDRIRQVSDSDPSRVIFENSRKTIITSGTPLKLEEGYELAIKSIDIDGNKVYVELTKNGNVIDSAVVIPPHVEDDTYIYSKDTDSTESVNVIEVHFKNVFRGADTNLATVDRIRQVSDSNSTQVMNSYDELLLTSSKPLELKGRYELAIKSIDIDGNKVYVVLSKNEAVIDSAVIIMS